MKTETNDNVDNTSPQGIEYTYKLIKGGDGHLYVSIQPLMKDIAISVQKMHDMDISHLNEEQQKIFDLKMLGLTTVYEFLGAFITEQQLRDSANELKGNIPLNVSDVTITGPQSWH